LIKNDDSTAEAPIQWQFANPLLDSLEYIGTLPTQCPVAIIVDALDECGDLTSQKSLFTLLADELDKLPVTFRFLITSQEEPNINGTLVDRPYNEPVITNANDILLFLQDKMATIWKHHSAFGLVAGWPGEAMVLDLVRHSADLFICALLAANFTNEGPNLNEQINLVAFI
jgi:hypothetical protein